MDKTMVEQGTGRCPPGVEEETWMKLLATIDRVASGGRVHISWGPDYYEATPQKRAEMQIAVYEEIEKGIQGEPLKFNDSTREEVEWTDECDTSKCPFPCACRGEGESEASKKLGEFVTAQLNAAVEHWNKTKE